jgi:hypothetical protein
MGLEDYLASGIGDTKGGFKNDRNDANEGKDKKSLYLSVHLSRHMYDIRPCSSRPNGDR